MKKKKKIETFTYNDTITLLHVFRDITLPFRYDCNGSIPITISETIKSYIYLTNLDEFILDYIKYTKTLHFDVIKNEGYIFNSYTYINNSLRKCK